MNDTKIRMRLLVLIVMFVSAVTVWALPQQSSSQSVTKNLHVYFLDVGQGDAIFIETPSGVQVLIDGGPDAMVLQQLASVMGFFDTDIDMIVGTHPDKDHIGGLIDVLKKYTVHTILTTENISDTDTSKMYNTLKNSEGAEVVYARRGQEISLDASTTLRVLFPDSDPTHMESNTSSIVLQLQYGSSTFMFTGDSPKSIEEYLVLTEGEHLKSDVLKVGHHGSRTSTSELYLDEVRPEIAIISAGANNRYGHPHVEVMDMLFNKGIQIIETAEEGTIAIASDGVHVWQEK